EPLLAVEDQAAADAGSPPDAEHGLELLAGAELELALDGDGDVVAYPDGRPEVLREGLAQRERAGPARQVAGIRDDAGLLVGIAGRAHADSLQIAGGES